MPIFFYGKNFLTVLFFFFCCYGRIEKSFHFDSCCCCCSFCIFFSAPSSQSLDAGALDNGKATTASDALEAVQPICCVRFVLALRSVDVSHILWGIALCGMGHGQDTDEGVVKFMAIFLANRCHDWWGGIVFGREDKCYTVDGKRMDGCILFFLYYAAFSLNSL